MSAFATFRGQISESRAGGRRAGRSHELCVFCFVLYLNQGEEITATQKQHVNLMAGHIDFCLLPLMKASNLIKY